MADHRFSGVRHALGAGQHSQQQPPFEIIGPVVELEVIRVGVTVFMDEGDDPHVKLRVWKVRDVSLYGFGKGTAEVTFDPGMMTYRRRR